jgi:uncharacterized protein YjiS (DUF1127 family)
VASITQTNTRSARSLSNLFQAMTYSLQARFAEAKERRRIAAELNMYSDRELMELGFSRSDIHSIAAGQYRR